MPTPSNKPVRVPGAPHPLATRKKALRMLAAGERPTHVARTLGIDKKTLSAWRKDAAAGRLPNQPREVLAPMDAAPGALSIVRADGESVSEMMARLIPVNTPEGVYRNMMLQKILKALEASPIPVPAKISEFKMLAGLASDLLSLSAAGSVGKKGQLPANTTLTVRVENLSKGPRVLDASSSVVLDAEVETEDENS